MLEANARFFSNGILSDYLNPRANRSVFTVKTISCVLSILTGQSDSSGLSRYSPWKEACGAVKRYIKYDNAIIKNVYLISHSFYPVHT